MRWQDRVYGEVVIEDPAILDLVGCDTFQRLRGIHQAGPSALPFPFKDVTRFEHSLGVFVLLRKLGAPPREQVAGLLHDISHTAFSHAVDFVVTSHEQDHHERLKPLMLGRDDVAGALAPPGVCSERLLRRFDLSAARAAPALALCRSAGLFPARRVGLRRGEARIRGAGAGPHAESSTRSSPWATSMWPAKRSLCSRP